MFCEEVGLALSVPWKYRFLELEHGVRSGSYHDAARSLPRKLYSGLSEIYRGIWG